MQLYAWTFAPDYDQSFGTTYIPTDSKEVYTLPVTGFLPSFMVQALNNTSKDI